MGELDESLYRAMVESLESLCGILPPPADGAPPEIPWTAGTRVAFAGPCQGVLAVDAHGPLARDIASRMAGPAADAAEEQDALGELANVVCGNILPAVFGPEALFNMGRPQRGGPGDRDPGRGLATATVPLAGGYLKATLRVLESAG